MTTTATQMAELASSLEAKVDGATTSLTSFPSGGAMLDVRRADGRLFVMSYAPEHGFGVDEVLSDDGFVTGYNFTTSQFPPAAEQLSDLLSDAAASCPPQTNVNMNLVVVDSRDLDASHRFDTSLGLSLQREKHGNGPEHYAARLGGMIFEIYPCGNGRSEGGGRYGFRLSNVDEVLSRLRERSVVIHSEPKDLPWGRRAVVEVPDGNKVELTQPTEASTCST